MNNHNSGQVWNNQNTTPNNEISQEATASAPKAKAQDRSWFLWYGPHAAHKASKVLTVSNPFELSVALGTHNAGQLFHEGDSYWFLTRANETPENVKDLASEIRFYEKCTIVPYGELPLHEIKQLGLEWKQLVRGLMSIVKDNPEEAGGLIGARVQVETSQEGGVIRKYQRITILMNSSGKDFRETIRTYLIQKVIFPQDEDHPMTYKEYPIQP